MTRYLDSDGLSHLVGKIKETDNDIVSRIDFLTEEMTSAGLTGTLPIASGGTGLTSSPSMLTDLATTSAADVLQEEPRPGVTGTLPIANGGTGNTTGNAATATKLATARTLRTNLASTSTASFDGSANVTPGVTGTLPIANGGTGGTSASAAISNFGIKDYVVAYGTSGIWTYIKWNSGYAECWGTASTTSITTQAFGSGYNFYGSLRANYPFTFAAVPVETANASLYSSSVSSGYGGLTLRSSNQAYNTTSTSSQYDFWRPTSVSTTSGYTLRAQIHVIGRWK